jgi:hypothetical protein
MFLLMFILLTTSLLAVFGPPIQAISNAPTVLTTTLEVDDSLLAVNATILEVISAHAWTNHGTEVNAAIR